jgi:hypothetical protein
MNPSLLVAARGSLTTAVVPLSGPRAADPLTTRPAPRPAVTGYP